MQGTQGMHRMSYVVWNRTQSDILCIPCIPCIPANPLLL
jgi:hypothetical protein